MMLTDNFCVSNSSEVLSRKGTGIEHTYDTCIYTPRWEDRYFKTENGSGDLNL